MKETILFLNHKTEKCGIYQYGLRIKDIIAKNDVYLFIYKEVDSYAEYMQLITHYKQTLKAIIYNYSSITMSWLNVANIQRNAKNIGIMHAISDIFDLMIYLDPKHKETDNIYCLPRPIYENVDTMLSNHKSKHADFISAYTDSNIPIFGSFGFATNSKGFENIIHLVSNQYEQAVIKIVMPGATFYEENYPEIEAKKCLAIPRKQGIQLMITHEFFSTEDILLFLKSNTMNIFLYNNKTKDINIYNIGISSVIDLAVSVDVPIGISDSHMFRNIYHDKIFLYKTPIKECMKFSKNYIKQFAIEYSHENFNNKLNKIVDSPANKIFYNGKAGQDFFVIKMLEKKLNGYFLELGVEHFSNKSKTIMLEKKYNWQGISIENKDFVAESYRLYRNNSLYINADPTIIDLDKILLERKFPNNIDYLQIDMDVPNSSTLRTLANLSILLNKYKFATITLKHDIYAGDYHNTRNLARSIFARFGYILIFPDVKIFWEGSHKPYEDWYVHPDLVNRELIAKVKTDASLPFSEIIQILNKQL